MFFPLAFFTYRQLLLRYLLNENIVLSDLLLSSLVIDFSYSDDHFLLFTPLLLFTYSFYYLWHTLILNKNIFSLRKLAMSFLITTILLLSGMLLQGNVLVSLPSIYSSAYSMVTEAKVSWNVFLSPTVFFSYSMAGGGCSYFHQVATTVKIWVISSYILISLLFIPMISKKCIKEIGYPVLLVITFIFLVNQASKPFSLINKILFYIFSSYLESWGISIAEAMFMVCL